MNMHRPESTEQQITKVGSHGESATQKFQDQYQHMMSSGKDFLNNASKTVTNEASHLDIPQIWNNGVKQIESGVDDTAQKGWKALDSNSTTHWVKHDLCNDDPFKVAVVGSAALAVGAVAALAAAPVVAEATGIGVGVAAIATTDAAISAAATGLVVGTMGYIGVKINSDNRPHQ